jgi:hypothetical protein
MTDEAIQLGSGANYVELRCLELGKAPGMSDSDLRLSISVHDNGCAASYEQVWIAKEDWSRFLVSLFQLERDREGHAALLSMSPEEFELHFQIRRRGGPVDAYGFLSRYHFHYPAGTVQSRVYYSVPIDPSMLRQLLDLFVALSAPAE